MNGSPVPSSASRSAMLVWVKPPGLMTMNATPFGLGAVDALDQLVLRIALKRHAARAPASRATGSRARLDARERVGAVDGRFPRAEQIEVRAVQQQQAGHGPFGSSL